MADLPDVSRFNNTDVTEAQFKSAFSALLDFLKELAASVSSSQGGLYSFTSKANFEANKASVPANSKVEINSDDDDAGQYTWDGEVLTKSLYDVLLQSKMYTVQTVNKTENQLKDIYLSLLKFFIQYETDFSILLSKTNQFNQYSFNQKVIDLFMNIDSIHKNSRSGNQDITAFYALFYELNKLDGIDL